MKVAALLVAPLLLAGPQQAIAQGFDPERPDRWLRLAKCSDISQLFSGGLEGREFSDRINEIAYAGAVMGYVNGFNNGLAVQFSDMASELVASDFDVEPGDSEDLWAIRAGDASAQVSTPRPIELQDLLDWCSVHPDARLSTAAQCLVVDQERYAQVCD